MLLNGTSDNHETFHIPENFLHPKQEKILAFLGRFYESRKFAPDIREIMYGTNISSTSIVSYHINALRDAGLIDFENGCARTIRLKGAIWLSPKTCQKLYENLSEVVLALSQSREGALYVSQIAEVHKFLREIEIED